LAGKKLKSHLSVRPGYIRALNNPLSVSFNFHNFLWNGSPPPEDLKFKFRTSESEKIDGNPFFEIKHANYFLIELPAVYSKKDEELEKGLMMLDDLVRQSKAVWYSGNEWFFGMAANKGYASFADVEESRKAGLMSDKIAAFYADEIDELAEDYLGETRYVDMLTRKIFSKK